MESRWRAESGHEHAALLSHPVSNLRKDVTTALGEIRHPDALPFLEQAAEDADPDVRKIAHWSIHLIYVAQT